MGEGLGPLGWVGWWGAQVWSFPLIFPGASECRSPGAYRFSYPNDMRLAHLEMINLKKQHDGRSLFLS